MCSQVEPSVNIRKEKRWSCIFCDKAETKSLTRPLFRNHLILVHSADLEKHQYPNGYWADRIIPISGEKLAHQRKRVLIRKCPPSIRKHLHDLGNTAEGNLLDLPNDLSDLPPLIPIQFGEEGERERSEGQTCGQSSEEEANKTRNWSLQEYLPELNDDRSDKLNETNMETDVHNSASWLDSIYCAKFTHVEGFTYPRVSDILAHKQTRHDGSRKTDTTTAVDQRVESDTEKPMVNDEFSWRNKPATATSLDRDPGRWIGPVSQSTDREHSMNNDRREPYRESLDATDEQLIGQAVTDLQLFGNRNKFRTIDKLLAAHPNRSRREVELIVETCVLTRRRSAEWIGDAVFDVKTRQEALIEKSDRLLFDICELSR